MGEMTFRSYSGSWVTVETDPGSISVSYQPEFRRVGMRMEVVDDSGLVIDTHELVHSFPTCSQVEAFSSHVPDEDRALRWVVTHLSRGMISLDELSELIDDSGCHPLDGAEYEIDGVAGKLEIRQDPTLVTFEGEVIPLNEEELARLEPIRLR